ncbi:hypothetical protein ACOWMN_02755 [Helicobacter pylori]
MALLYQKTKNYQALLYARYGVSVENTANNKPDNNIKASQILQYGW